MFLPLHPGSHRSGPPRLFFAFPFRSVPTLFPCVSCSLLLFGVACFPPSCFSAPLIKAFGFPKTFSPCPGFYMLRAPFSGPFRFGSPTGRFNAWRLKTVPTGLQGFVLLGKDSPTWVSTTSSSSPDIPLHGGEYYAGAPYCSSHFLFFLPFALFLS